jgi:3-phenylpropionate/trans-cinnamate dioxygenase ferredoxin reductase subunit
LRPPSGHLQTSAENVFAAGDVANAHHPFFGRRIRVEHWANALNQAPAAARNMLGRGEAYERVPYFFSDQYEMGMVLGPRHRPGRGGVSR